MKIASLLGFKPLVKFSKKPLHEINLQEVQWLIADFLEGRNDRFDEAALTEFLNETADDEKIRKIQTTILQLESKVFENGEELGLWSEQGHKGLQEILSSLLQDLIASN